VPFFARWAGRIEPGSTSDETICHTDLMATVAALLGASLPADAGEDSYNLLPALFGQTRAGPIREATVHPTRTGRFPIRRGNRVLIDAPTGDDNNDREPAWLKQERGYRPHDRPGELYDLSRDLAERRNLYDEHPQEVAQLKALLEKYQRGPRSAPAMP